MPRASSPRRPLPVSGCGSTWTRCARTSWTWSSPSAAGCSTARPTWPTDGGRCLAPAASGRGAALQQVRLRADDVVLQDLRKVCGVAVAERLKQIAVLDGHLAEMVVAR